MTNKQQPTTNGRTTHAALRQLAELILQSARENAIQTVMENTTKDQRAALEYLDLHPEFVGWYRGSAEMILTDCQGRHCVDYGRAKPLTTKQAATVWAMVDKQLPRALRTKLIDADTTRTPKTDDFCIRCNRDLKPGQGRRFVHCIRGHLEALHPEDESRYVADAADMGCYPIGNDCARLLGMEWTVPPATQTLTIADAGTIMRALDAPIKELVAEVTATRQQPCRKCNAGTTANGFKCGICGGTGTVAARFTTNHH